jgi:hypothetical protein
MIHHIKQINANKNTSNITSNVIPHSISLSKLENILKSNKK